MPDGSTLSFIFAFLILAALCGYFSSSETAISSVNRVHIITKADTGDKRAKNVLYILDNYEKALSTILIGNNIVNVGCATIVTIYTANLYKAGVLKSESAALYIATLVTTVVLFLFAEMLPKCYAKACNERVSLRVSGSLVFLMKLFAPISAVFGAIGKGIAHLLRRDKEDIPTVTEDEIISIVDSMSSEEDGEIDEDTASLVKSAVDFTYKTAGDIYVPWDSVLKISNNTEIEKIAEIIADCNHSRIPVVDKYGNLKGILQIRKFLKQYIKDPETVVLSKLTDRPFFASEEIPVNELLEKLSNHRKNLAVIKNSKGDVLGIVTVEDILEELVGEIYDEEDTEAEV